jgi:O-antigen ligase
VFSSILNYKNVQAEPVLRYLTASICFILLAEMGLTQRPKQYLQGLLMGAGIPCLINIYTIFRYASSHGMKYGEVTVGYLSSISTQAWYYFTHANASFFIGFPVLIALYYYLLLYNEKKIYVAHIFSLIMLAAYAYADSTTSTIVLVFFCVYMLLFWNPHRKSILRAKISRWTTSFITNKWVIISLVALAAVLLVFARITDQFTEIIAALGKSTDLTHRFPVWAKTVDQILADKMHLFFGYGWEREVVTSGKIGINHAHNIMLELLYRGGVVGLVLFVLFTVRYMHGLKSTKMGKMLGIGLITCLLCTMMDFYLYRYEVFLIYVMIAHSYELEEVSGVSVPHSEQVGA